jgi:putative SOS response-associated peptidase YedK
MIGSGASALETYTIITTNPNELVEALHNRMPVILHRNDYGRWLAPPDPAHLSVDFLRPFPAEEMKACKVAVGNVDNKDNPSPVEAVT